MAIAPARAGSHANAVRPVAVALALAAAILARGGAAAGLPPANPLHLLPMPRHLVAGTCTTRLPRTVSQVFDPAALEIVDRRWKALGIPTLRRTGGPADVVVTHAPLGPQAYRLTTGRRVRISASDAAGAFYAAATLAQLPQRGAAGWRMPCVRIEDRPALRWRILSDDVSRGPLPTMRYFEERIRTIAAFKMNGYSPYMENTFVDPHDPLPAPLDGITPAQLRELARYAARFHVALIPEQQTFAHMHQTLRYERYAGDAEFPHGFLLSPAVPQGLAYVTRLLRDELAVVPHPPFFHIGSDEASMLGEGRSKALVAARGKARVYADHVDAVARVIAPSGARIMLWDDGIEQDPRIMRMIARSDVVVNWHYDIRKSYESTIDLIASGGFSQMVAPGDHNWNQLFPDVNAALQNEGRFISEGKAAHVLGLFQTVWHDDGETLYEATWYPVLYAAASAWEQGAIAPQRFQADFPHAFFGSPDQRFGDDVAKLADAQSRLTAAPYDTTDRLFWSDPFDAAVASRMDAVDLHRVRLDAESVEEHLLLHAPPLHANAARVMFLAARRYDVLARAFQIAREVRWYYDDARAQEGKPQSRTIRDLFWCKYWFWELRDDYEGLAALYAAAWRYESRDGHLASNLERYHLAAQLAIRRADDIDRATYEDVVRRKRFPPLDEVLGLRHD